MKGTKVHNISQFSSIQKLEDFSLQRLMKNIILIGQCFAFLPVDGITQETAKLKFRWTSIKTLYTIFTLIVQTFLSVIVLIHSIINSQNFFSFVNVVWNTRASLGIIFFLKLARKWPMLLQKWSEMEYDMLGYGPLSSLRLRFKIMSLIFLIVGLVEHVMYVYQTLKNVLNDMNENDNFLEKYFLIQNAGLLEYFGYSLWTVILLEFSTFITTFSWQFCNLFIILLSSALAERFRQISNKINAKEVLNESQWKEIRKQYNVLSLLCKTLNNCLAEVVLLSFFGNVYFLALVVFQCFKPRTTIEAIFFGYSILFYIAHVVTVCLYAAWIHDESLSAISKISSLPVKNMSHDANRLLNQMSTRDIAITGGGLFKVTRGIILNVGAVIVTLQLILTEFKATL